MTSVYSPELMRPPVKFTHSHYKYLASILALHKGIITINEMEEMLKQDCENFNIVKFEEYYAVQRRHYGW